MPVGAAKITAVVATAIGVAPSLAFVALLPQMLQCGTTNLLASPVGGWRERGSIGKTAEGGVVRSWATRRAKQQRRCWVKMSSKGPPTQGKFVKMGGTEDSQSFGPRCILASGLSLEESGTVRSILEDGDQGQQDSTPLVVLTPDIADKRVGDVLADAAMIGLLQGDQEETGNGSTPGAMPVIIFSGFTNLELKAFVMRFRSETGVRAAFAKAVPNAMTKSVARLCEEIAQDHADALAGKLDGSRD